MPKDFKKPFVAKIIFLVLILPFLNLQEIISLVFFQLSKDEFSYKQTFFGNTSIIDLTNFPGCNKTPPLV